MNVFFRPEVVLLLDEPTAACDAVSCLAVEAAIVRSGATCLFITHDDRQAARIAHRRIILTADSGTGTKFLDSFHIHYNKHLYNFLF